jgi:hypothetical protein
MEDELAADPLVVDWHLPTMGDRANAAWAGDLPVRPPQISKGYVNANRLMHSSLC